MSADVDDTVIGVARTAPGSPAPAPGGDLDDTIIVATRARDAWAPALPLADPIGEASTWYAFRIGEGAVVALDAPARIGRRPSAPRIAGVKPVRLVTVPSLRSEVSKTHVAIHQLGASVVVTDLRSTNGSTVLLPGSVPRTLRQGESVVVSPGTLVDIGDNNIIEILPRQSAAFNQQ